MEELSLPNKATTTKQYDKQVIEMEAMRPWTRNYPTQYTGLLSSASLGVRSDLPALSPVFSSLSALASVVRRTSLWTVWTERGWIASRKIIGVCAGARLSWIIVGDIFSGDFSAEGVVWARWVVGVVVSEGWWKTSNEKLVYLRELRTL
jgi:hypothetical protein